MGVGWVGAAAEPPEASPNKIARAALIKIRLRKVFFMGHLLIRKVTAQAAVFGGVFQVVFCGEAAKRTGGFGGFAPNCRRPPPPVGPDRGRGGGPAAGAALRHFAISNA